jgi:hypothetical protein
VARLTPEVQNEIAAFLRAGGFPTVAAEAAGISAAQFTRWMRLGRQPRPKRRFRDFVKAVTHALALARLSAEVEIHKKKPLEWLKSGPPRDAWGPDAQPSAPSGLDDPEIRELFARVLTALEPFPEAHAAVRKAMDR